MIIDSHAHVGKGYFMDDPIQSNVPPERVLKMSREAGVDKTIIFPVNYPEYSGAMREMYEAVQKYPNELMAYARVNPDNDNAMEVLSNAIENYKFKGLKLHPHNDNWKVDSPATRKVLNRAREYGIPVLFDPVKELEDIYAYTKEYPTINFIIAHMGGFFDWKVIAKTVDLVEASKNVYTDTPFAMVHIMLKDAAKRVPDKILFGTDAPAIHAAAEMEKIRSLHLGRQVEDNILGGNIARLLKL